MNGLFTVFPFAILLAYSAALFTVIYLAVRLAIRHERRRV